MGLEHRRPGEFAGRSDALASSTLAGRRLFVARVGWLAVFFLTVGLFLASIPAYYEAIVSYSDSVFEPEAVRVSLEGSGVSIRFFAICLLSIACVSTVVWVAVAAVIFWRRADNWMALFASLSLITFGTMSLPPSLPALADQSSAVWLPINVLALIGTVVLYIFYLLFPNGRFVPRWTRWAVVLFAAHEVFYWLFPKSSFDIATSFPYSISPC